MSWTVTIKAKTAKELRNRRKNSFEVECSVMALIHDLETQGPAVRWPNYGRLLGQSKSIDRRHCHLQKGKPTWVACWEVDKKTKGLRCIMSAHTRKHPTKTNALLKKEISAKLKKVTNTDDLVTLNKVIDKYLPQDEKSLSPEEAFEDDWSNRAKRLGRIIQGLRFREGMNQSDLAKTLRGVKQSNISAWENGKEKIPERRLKQLSELFGTDLLKSTK